MIDKVFSITGNKIASFILDESSLKFSSARFHTVESFKEAFTKKLSLATKVEIKYDSIKYIRKEDTSSEVIILYKKKIGIPFDCGFAFLDIEDYETFFTFFEKERYFTKSHETLTPFKAVRLHLIGLLMTIAFFVFTYYQAIEIANGTVEEASDWKARVYDYLVGLMGDKGVIVLGILVSGYLVYITWKRFSNPISQLKLLPPNS
jgi:hypothetical protein